MDHRWAADRRFKTSALRYPQWVGGAKGAPPTVFEGGPKGAPCSLVCLQFTCVRGEADILIVIVTPHPRGLFLLLSAATVLMNCDVPPFLISILIPIKMKVWWLQSPRGSFPEFIPQRLLQEELEKNQHNIRSYPAAPKSIPSTQSG